MPAVESAEAGKEIMRFYFEGGTNKGLRSQSKLTNTFDAYMFITSAEHIIEYAWVKG
ncbi:MAG: hypothetical protein V7K53_03810 [Nostoc sp.]|uniref:hypothetical protein n=1 Tax=Nostoc sp. TaxID=1180 RepID=UPI002FF4FEAD